MNAIERDTLRRRVHLVLEGGQTGGLLGGIVEAVLIVLILLNVVGYTLQSVPAIRRPYWFDSMSFEVVSVAIFSVEYDLRLWTSVEDPIFGQYGPSRGRLSAAAQPLMVIDFLAIAPVYFALHSVRRSALPATGAARSGCLRSRAIRRRCPRWHRSSSTNGARCSARFLLLAAPRCSRPPACTGGRRGAAQGLRLDPHFHVVGDHDADHGGLWRRRAHHLAGPAGRRPSPW